MNKRMNLLCMVPGGRSGAKGWNLQVTDFDQMKQELRATEQRFIRNELPITERMQQRDPAGWEVSRLDGVPSCLRSQSANWLRGSE